MVISIAAHGMRKGRNSLRFGVVLSSHSRFSISRVSDRAGGPSSFFLPEAPLWVAVNERDQPVGLCC